MLEVMKKSEKKSVLAKRTQAEKNLVTPMMAQYLSIRKQIDKETLLFYRMGDFYELFFEDAEKAAHALDITLTKRGKHQEQAIPMCGVPVISSETYLSRLIKKGFKVAVCEQVEDPKEAKKRGYKAVVKREIVRVVTPGTLTEETLLEARTANYICAISQGSGSRVSGSRVSGSRVSGSQISGSQISGSQISGSRVSGKELSGKMSAKERKALTQKPDSGLHTSSSVESSSQQWGLAFADISTGEFVLTCVSEAELLARLIALSPRELLLSDTDFTEKVIQDLIEITGLMPTSLPRVKFTAKMGYERLKAQYQVLSLEAFGDFARLEYEVAGALLDYLSLTQAGKPVELSPPQHLQAQRFMVIDPATRASLEINHTQSGYREGSLLSSIDRSVTPAGARLFAQYIAQPLLDLETICQRQDAIAFFQQEATLAKRVHQAFVEQGTDIFRSLSRLLLNRGSARDLASLVVGLDLGQCLVSFLAKKPDIELPALIKDSFQVLDLTQNPELAKLVSDVKKALSSDLPVTLREGGFIAPGWRADLDEARSLRDKSRQVIMSLQSEYAQKSGVQSVKIRHNNILGYFLEVTARHADAFMVAPLCETFIHRQTLANVVRFSTVALGELEVKITNAVSRALALELEIFEAFKEKIAQHADRIRHIAQALAVLDVALSQAHWADEVGAVRPIVDHSQTFTIQEGRHPVVEAALKQKGKSAFTPNHARMNSSDKTIKEQKKQKKEPLEAGEEQEELTFLHVETHTSRAVTPVPDRGVSKPEEQTLNSELEICSGKEDNSVALQQNASSKINRLLFVTGPNMAGKSTYLRQNALMVILAQAGCFVPASFAHIGLVDRLFSRVGAADDLARGRSTFMAEMIETASILNQATERSFVILDEIGRGTATFDGLAIAWAVAEYLHDKNRCRALFATHYHELTTLAQRLSSAGNICLKAVEWKGDLVFLHEVCEGTADRSYGIQVARLAGLPLQMIRRAEKILNRLESQKSEQSRERLHTLPLFETTLSKKESFPSVEIEKNTEEGIKKIKFIPSVEEEPSPEILKLQALGKALAALNPDSLTPREALESLYTLKKIETE